MEKDLAIDLMGPPHSNWLGIIHTVIAQAGQDALQSGAARRFRQADHCLYLLFRGPRNLVSGFPRANCGKAGQQSLYSFALGTPILQMGEHLLMLIVRNGVPDVVSPLSNIEMARSFSHKVTFLRLNSNKGEYGFRVRIPLLAVDG